MAKPDFKSVLNDFAQDVNNGSFTDEQLFEAYPEFNNDIKMLDAAYQYVNTLNAKKYDEKTLQGKFPEFFSPEEILQEASRQATSKREAMEQHVPLLNGEYGQKQTEPESWQFGKMTPEQLGAQPMPVGYYAMNPKAQADAKMQGQIDALGKQAIADTTSRNDATFQEQARISDYENRVPEDVKAQNAEVARKIDERIPMFKQQWASDRALFDEAVAKAREDANQAIKEYTKSVPMRPGAGGEIGYMMSMERRANEAKSPEKVVANFDAALDEAYVAKLKELFKSKEIDGKDTRPMTDEEIAAMYKNAGVMSPEDYELYKDYVMKQVELQFADMNMPKDKLDYFVRKVMQGNIIGMLYQAGTKPLSQRQVEMQGMQQFAQQNSEAAGLDVAAEVANIALDLPLMYLTGGIGTGVERVTARTATRALAKQLERRGFVAGEDIALRLMAQNNWWRAGMSALREGTTFSVLNTINAIGSDIFNEDMITPKVAVAAAEGFLTGAAMGGIRIPNSHFTSFLQDQFGRKTGSFLGATNSLIARTNIMVGGQMLGYMVNGGSLSDFDWGSAFLHAGLMNIGFDFLGASKIFAENARNTPNYRSAIDRTITQMTSDPTAHLFTKEDIAQLNRAGIAGKNVREVVDSLLRVEGDSAELQRTDNVGRPIQEIQERLDSVFTNPEIDTEVKAKLYQIFTGKPLQAFAISVDDEVQQEGDKFVVRTYDNTGMTYRTRVFDNGKDAEKYRQKMVEETRPFILQWCENVGATAFRTYVQKNISDEVIRYMAEQRNIPVSEVVQKIKTAVDETMRGEVSDESAQWSEWYADLMEEAMGKTRLAEAYKDMLDGKGGKGFRAAYAKTFAKEHGVSAEKVMRILNSKYWRLSKEEKAIYDEYIQELQYRIRTDASATEWADFTIHNPKAIGVGVDVPPMGSNPVSDAARKVFSKPRKEDKRPITLMINGEPVDVMFSGTKVVYNEDGSINHDKSGKIYFYAPVKEGEPTLIVGSHEAMLDALDEALRMQRAENELPIEPIADEEPPAEPIGEGGGELPEGEEPAGEEPQPEVPQKPYPTLEDGSPDYNAIGNDPAMTVAAAEDTGLNVDEIVDSAIDAIKSQIKKTDSDVKGGKITFLQGGQIKHDLNEQLNQWQQIKDSRTPEKENDNDNDNENDNKDDNENVEPIVNDNDNLEQEGEGETPIVEEETGEGLGEGGGTPPEEIDLSGDDVVLMYTSKGNNYLFCRKDADGNLIPLKGSKRTPKTLQLKKGENDTSWEEIEKRPVYMEGNPDKIYYILSAETKKDLENYRRKSGMIAIADATTGKIMDVDVRLLHWAEGGDLVRRSNYYSPEYKALKESAKTMDDILDYEIYRFKDKNGKTVHVTLRNMISSVFSTDTNNHHIVPSGKRITNFLANNIYDMMADNGESAYLVTNDINLHVKDAIRVWNRLAEKEERIVDADVTSENGQVDKTKSLIKHVKDLVKVLDAKQENGDGQYFNTKNAAFRIEKPKKEAKKENDNDNDNQNRNEQPAPQGPTLEQQKAALVGQLGEGGAAVWEEMAAKPDGFTNGELAESLKTHDVDSSVGTEIAHMLGRRTVTAEMLEENDVKPAIELSAEEGTPEYDGRYGSKEAGERHVQYLKDAGLPIEVIHQDDIPKYMDNNKQRKKYYALRARNGVLYGFFSHEQGKIYVVQEQMNPNAPIHEYGHMWLAGWTLEHPEEWAELKKYLKEDPVWEQVKGSESYADLESEDRIAGEVFSRLFGEYWSQSNKYDTTRLDDALERRGLKARLATFFRKIADWIVRKLANSTTKWGKKMANWTKEQADKFNKTFDFRGKQYNDYMRAAMTRPVEDLIKMRDVVAESVNGDFKVDFDLMSAWHGGAAYFDHFDFKFIGSGEGNQAFGWGGYVSQSKNVSIGYADIARDNNRGAATRGRKTFVPKYKGEPISAEMLIAKANIKGRKHIVDGIKEDLEYTLGDAISSYQLGHTYDAIEDFIDTIKNKMRTEIGNVVSINKEIETVKNLINEKGEDGRFITYERINKLAKEVSDHEAIYKAYQDVLTWIVDNDYDIERRPKGATRHLYQLEIPDDNGKNYFPWDEEVDDETLINIVQQAKSQGLLKGNGYDDLRNVIGVKMNIGGNFYRWIQEGIAFAQERKMRETITICGYKVFDNSTPSGYSADFWKLCDKIIQDEHLDELQLPRGREARTYIKDLAKRVSNYLIVDAEFDFDDAVAACAADLMETGYRESLQGLSEIYLRMGGWLDYHKTEVRADRGLVRADKKVSQLLHSIGYVGNRVPVGFAHGNDSKGMFNYVIFDENDIKIVNHTEFMADENGTKFVNGNENQNENKGGNDNGLRRRDEEVLSQRFSHEELQSSRGLLTEAEAFLQRGSHRSSPEIQTRPEGNIELADDQEFDLEDFAKERGIWVDDTTAYLEEQYGEPIAKEGESTVYANEDGTRVIKEMHMNDFLEPQLVLDRMVLQNHVSNAPLTLTHIGRDRDGEFVFVVEQPFVYGEQMTPDEIEEYMNSIGFERYSKNRPNDYINREAGIIAEDIHDENIVLTPEGPVIIDGDFRLNTQNYGLGGTRTTGPQEKSTEVGLDMMADDGGPEIFPDIKTTYLNRRTFLDKVRDDINATMASVDGLNLGATMMTEAAERVRAAADRTHPILMLQKSIEAFDGVPLPHRYNIRSRIESKGNAYGSFVERFSAKEKKNLSEQMQSLSDFVEKKTDLLKRFPTDLVNYKEVKKAEEAGENIDLQLWKLDAWTLIERYLIACESLERKEFDRETRGEEMFEGYMDVSMADYKAIFEDAVGTEKTEALWDAIRACTDISLDYALRYGIIDRASYDMFKLRRFYIPEMNFATDRQRSEFQRKANQWHSRNKPVAFAHRAEGGDSLADNIIAQIVYNTQDAVSRAMDNDVRIWMAELLENSEAWCEANGFQQPKRVWYLRQPDGTYQRTTDMPSDELLALQEEFNTTIQGIEDDIKEQQQARKDNAAKLKAARARLKELDDAAIEERKRVNDEIARLKTESEEITAALKWLRDALGQCQDKMPIGRSRIVRNAERDYAMNTQDRMASTVSYFKNGDAYEMFFGGIEPVALCLNNVFNNDWTLEVVRDIASHRAALLTTYNMSFSPVNVIRDSRGARKKGMAEVGLAFVADYYKNLGSAHTMHALGEYLRTRQFNESTEAGRQLKLFIENGGQTGYSNYKELQDIRQQMEGKYDWVNFVENKIWGLGGAAKYMTEFSEIWTRYSIFRSRMDELMPDVASGIITEEDAIRKSINDAMNFSINMARRGAGDKFINVMNSISLFSNPAIQGASSWVRTMDGLTKNNKIWRVLWAMGGSQILLGFLSAFFNPDDKENGYEVSEYDREHLLAFGDYRWYPNEWERPFMLIGVNAALMMHGQRDMKQATMSVMKSIVENLVPAPPAITNGVTSLLDVIRGNKSAGQMLSDFLTPDALRDVKYIAEGKSSFGTDLDYYDWKTMPQWKLDDSEGNMMSKRLSYWLYRISGGPEDGHTKFKLEKDAEGNPIMTGMKTYWDVSPRVIRAWANYFIPQSLQGFTSCLFGLGEAAFTEKEIKDTIAWKDVPLLGRFRRAGNADQMARGDYWALNNIVKDIETAGGFKYSVTNNSVNIKELEKQLAAQLNRGGDVGTLIEENEALFNSLPEGTKTYLEAKVALELFKKTDRYLQARHMLMSKKEYEDMMPKDSDEAKKRQEIYEESLIEIRKLLNEIQDYRKEQGVDYNERK